MFIIFAFTLGLSAALVMSIQPLLGRFVLPVLGGTPAVWNTAMLFFQAGLLAGYSYAYLLSRWLPPFANRIVHVVLLSGACFAVSVAFAPPDQPPTHPTLWLLTTLLAGWGVPFVAAASTGPLLQRWFADANVSNPYSLYAASNAGSFLGILLYPFAIEPNLTLPEQAHSWRWGFIALAVATGICALATAGSGQRVLAPAASAAPVAWSQRGRWLLLALAPSSLLLSVTSYLTIDLAPAPLLWLLPLALYLLSFTIVFARDSLQLHRLLVRWQPAVLIVLLLLVLREANEPLGVVLTLHLLGFFWLALVCHGELARTRPSAVHLTEFYFWLALGGVLGGAFNALAAPHIFTSYAEYPLMLVLVAALRPRDVALSAEERGSSPTPRRWTMWTDLGVATIVGSLAGGALLLTRNSSSTFATLGGAIAYGLPLVVCYLLQFRIRRFALSLGAVFLASTLDPGVHGDVELRRRSFFGVHRVASRDGIRRLVHGNTQHGMQFIDLAKRHIPLAYYHPTSPIGKLLTSLAEDSRRTRIGLVGLGAGALAAYAQTGEHWTFFEIDPAVIHIARDAGLFTYLQDSRGRIDIVPGDARLTLQQTEDKFGVLIIDAFGSDAIPVHLLTREAFSLYRERLRPGGVLAVHISNRYVDLEPVLANHAHEEDWVCTVAEDLVAESTYPGKLPSVWVFLAEQRGHLPRVAASWRNCRPEPAMRTWTDDYTNLLHVMKTVNGGGD